MYLFHHLILSKNKQWTQSNLKIDSTLNLDKIFHFPTFTKLHLHFSTRMITDPQRYQVVFLKKLWLASENSNKNMQIHRLSQLRFNLPQVRSVEKLLWKIQQKLTCGRRGRWQAWLGRRAALSSNFWGWSQTGRFWSFAHLYWSTFTDNERDFNH